MNNLFLITIFFYLALLLKMKHLKKETSWNVHPITDFLYIHLLQETVKKKMCSFLKHILKQLAQQHKTYSQYLLYNFAPNRETCLANSRGLFVFQQQYWAQFQTLLLTTLALQSGGQHLHSLWIPPKVAALLFQKTPCPAQIQILQ